MWTPRSLHQPAMPAAPLPLIYLTQIASMSAPARVILIFYLPAVRSSPYRVIMVSVQSSVTTAVNHGLGSNQLQVRHRLPERPSSTWLSIQAIARTWSVRPQLASIVGSRTAPEATIGRRSGLVFTHL